MTDEKRCIRCELVKDKSKFDTHAYSYSSYCDVCWREYSNDELDRFEGVLNHKLFYLRYPNPRPDSVSIPDDKESIKKIVKDVKKTIEKEIEIREAVKKSIERKEDFSSSDKAYKEVLLDINQLHSQQSQVIQLEKQYK